MPAQEDPRRETNNKFHKLGDIVMSVFFSVLSEMVDWAGKEGFAVEKRGVVPGIFEVAERHPLPSSFVISRKVRPAASVLGTKSG